MNSGKISIITAVYNNRFQVEQALYSLRQQTYPNIEHILVDGRSTDGTTEYLRSQLDRKTLLISEPDQGIYDALNKGIDLATGDVVGFLHSDDLLAHPESIFLIAEEFKKKSVEAIYGDLLYVEQKNPEKIIRYWQSGEYHLSKLRNGWMPPHPTFYMKKNKL